MAGERRGAAGLLAAGVCVVTLLTGAGGAAAIPAVSIEGGTGLPGGTVHAVAALADDPQGTAVAAILTVSYPDPPLGIEPLDCTLAERLSATHQLGAEAPQPGQLILTIAPSGAAAPLQDGDLATCAVGIALGAPAGTAALELAAMLRNADAQEVPAESIDGAIFIESGEPTPTATPSHTPTATPTVTETPVPTATATATQTGTATRFQPTVLYDRGAGGSCTIVGPSSHAAWPLIGLLALLWRRRVRSR